MTGSTERPAVQPETSAVARGSLINLIAMTTGAALTFGLTVLVSRWLRPGGSGALFELIALFTIASNTFELGADTGLLRWISRARALGRLTDVRQVVVVALVPVGLIGAAAAAAVWLTAPELAHAFLQSLPPRQGILDIRMVAPLVPLGALSSCLIDAARGFGRMWPFLAIEGLGKPTTRIALVAGALLAGLGLSGAIVAWGIPVAAGLAASSLIFTAILRREIPRRASAALRRASAHAQSAAGVSRVRGERPAGRPAAVSESRRTDQPRGAGRHRSQGAGRSGGGRHRLPLSRLGSEFWRFTAPRAFQGTFQVIILWLDILLVGAVVSSYAAGIYAAVSKLAMVGTFVLEGNRLAIGPQLSALLARREHDRAAALFQTATRLLMLASWPLYLLLAIFPAVVLGIFGSRYTTGAAALAVLSLAMLVNLGTGNVTVVLLMGGKSSWSAINAGAAFVVNIGLNLLLLPRIGILGAAIAWGASIVVDNVSAMIELRWVLGLAPFGRGYGTVAAITLGCFGIPGIAARLVLGDTLLSMAAAVLAAMAAFVLTLYTARAPLHLAEMAASFRSRSAPAVSQEPGRQAA